MQRAILSRGRVLAGVVDQIEQNLFDGRRIGPHLALQHAIGRFDSKLEICLCGAVGQSFRGHLQQPFDRNGFDPSAGPTALQSSVGQHVAHQVRQPIGLDAQRFQIPRRSVSSRTMPSLSISAYMRNVVSGVRSSCVTAETNAARRSLKRDTPRKSTATATAARPIAPQATNSDCLIGENPWPVAGQCAGNQHHRQRRQAPHFRGGRGIGDGHQFGIRQQIGNVGKQLFFDRRPIQQAALHVFAPASETRRASTRSPSSHSGVIIDICTSAAAPPGGLNKPLLTPKFCDKVLL